MSFVDQADPAHGQQILDVAAYPNYPLAHFLLGAALGQLGRIEEARAEAQAGLALNQAFTIRRFRDGAESDNPAPEHL